MLGCTIPILRLSFDVCHTVCGGVLWSVLLVVWLVFGFLLCSWVLVGVLVLVIGLLSSAVRGIVGSGLLQVAC